MGIPSLKLSADYRYSDFIWDYYFIITTKKDITDLHLSEFFQTLIEQIKHLL